MTSRRLAARRRTAVAVALSLAGHAALVALIAFDLHRDPVEQAAPSLVEIHLARRERPLVSPPSADKPSPTAEPAATSPAARRDVAAPSPLPSALPGLAPGPDAPLAGPAPPPGEALPTALHTGCVGKRDQNTEARIDCKLEIWKVLDGAPPKALPGDTIPDDKESDWARVARRQDYRRRGLRPGGNASTIGCPQGNLGAGCLDEMLIPMTGSAAKSRRELPASGGR